MGLEYPEDAMKQARARIEALEERLERERDEDRCEIKKWFEEAQDSLTRAEALAARVEVLEEALRNIAVVGYSEDHLVNRAIARQTVTQARAALGEGDVTPRA